MKKAKQAENLDAMRHTAAHLLAAAVKDLWPGTHNAIGPATDDGFYQDFDFGDRVISEDDFPKIEKRMHELLKTWGPLVERSITAKEARKLFAKNPYKLELIEDFARFGTNITVNDPGNFLDLCRGGHTQDPQKTLVHFKLLSIAGAYWRGDEKRRMLTRIYGTAFAAEKELKDFLAMREEAKKRDHRKLGQQMDLFTFSALVGSGLPLFTPRGTLIRDELEHFLWSLQTPRGFLKVNIPHLAKPELYKTSGHWDKFADSLFHVRGKGGEEFVIKPMNCPHHTQIYASRPRSYKDLPLRLAEITTIYRDEQAGELLGLSRVRSITQDDAHIFCRPDQIREEIGVVMDIIQKFYAAFDFEIAIRLSLSDPGKPEAYLGTQEIWDMAENALRTELRAQKSSFTEQTGEAAFYGPKIDFTAIDSLKRRWQLATIQLDFNMPSRFMLSYTDEAGKGQAPVMIHRAVMGSVERFIAILLEHYAGALPMWLSPVQVMVLPISDEQNEYANKIAQQLREIRPSTSLGVALRVEVDTRPESIGKKIREAQMQKVPYMLVVGKKEVAAGTVAVRSRGKGDEDSHTVEAFSAQIRKVIGERL